MERASPVAEQHNTTGRGHMEIIEDPGGFLVNFMYGVAAVEAGYLPEKIVVHTKLEKPRTRTPHTTGFQQSSGSLPMRDASLAVWGPGLVYMRIDSYVLREEWMYICARYPADKSAQMLSINARGIYPTGKALNGLLRLQSEA